MLFSNSIYALFALKPGGYPRTQTSTYYTLCTKKVTETVKKTVTPEVTKTTEIYSYSTITNPGKQISTKTITITKSTSTAVSTSNVAAPANFIPIQSSVPGSSFTGSDDPAVLAKRSLQDLSKRDAPKAYPYGGKTYPKMVMCSKYTSDGKKCGSKKVKKTKTHTAPEKTVYSTETVVKTTTECPSAKATVTSTEIITSTGTSTAQTVTTSTTTLTTFTSTTTAYAACSTANLLNRINGEPPFELEGVPADRTFNIVQIRAANSLECCNLAFSPRPSTDAVSAPQFFVFDFRPDPSNPTSIIGTCSLAGDSAANPVCPVEQPIVAEVRALAQSNPLDPGTPNGALSTPTLGNAACGKIVGPQA